MDKKTTGIIATIVAALLCGCPGLLTLFFGTLFTLIAAVPQTSIKVFGNSQPPAALVLGIGSLCLGGLFVLIPIIMGVVMLRPKAAPLPPPPPTPAMPEEPLPPAI
jgi:hypothetical protein